jgi:hypothetical protein
VLVCVPVDVADAVAVAVGVPVEVCVAVAVAVAVPDPDPVLVWVPEDVEVPVEDAVAVPELVAVAVEVEVEVAEAVALAVAVDVREDVAVDVLVAEGVLVTDGQFCCSTMESSPTGPSSAEPSLMDRLTQATAGSHTPMPGLGAPVDVVASAAGIAEYGCTVISRCLRPASGPTRVPLPAWKLYTVTVTPGMRAPKERATGPLTRATRTVPR